MAKKPEKPGHYDYQGVAIVNSYGDIWGPEVFHDEAEAAKHLDKFWDGKCDWSKFSFVAASCRTKAEPGAPIVPFSKRR